MAGECARGTFGSQGMKELVEWGTLDNTTRVGTVFNFVLKQCIRHGIASMMCDPAHAHSSDLLHCSSFRRTEVKLDMDDSSHE